MPKTTAFKSIYRITLTLLLATSTAVAHAAETAETKQQQAQQIRRQWPRQLRQAFGFEDASFWQGATFVTSPKRSGAGALKWEKAH